MSINKQKYQEFRLRKLPKDLHKIIKKYSVDHDRNIEDVMIEVLTNYFKGVYRQ